MNVSKYYEMYLCRPCLFHRKLFSVLISGSVWMLALELESGIGICWHQYHCLDVTGIGDLDVPGIGDWKREPIPCGNRLMSCTLDQIGAPHLGIVVHSRCIRCLSLAPLALSPQISGRASVHPPPPASPSAGWWAAPISHSFPPC